MPESYSDPKAAARFLNSSMLVCTDPRACSTAAVGPLGVPISASAATQARETVVGFAPAALPSNMEAVHVPAGQRQRTQRAAADSAEQQIQVQIQCSYTSDGIR